MSSSEYQNFEIHNTEITYLKGVGPKRGSTLKKNGISTIGEILRHYPRRYLDRTNVKLIKDLKVGEQAVIIGKVMSFNLNLQFLFSSIRIDFKNSKLIAKNIVEYRKNKKIKYNSDLIEILNNLFDKNVNYKFLSRLFQSIRIEVNDEINALKEMLLKSRDFLKIKGRLVIISYHSIEDRIVKKFFKEQSSKCVCSVEIIECVCNHSPTIKIMKFVVQT